MFFLLVRVGSKRMRCAKDQSVMRKGQGQGLLFDRSVASPFPLLVEERDEVEAEC